jgi:surfactin family lipopeptide synthetase A
MRPSGDYGYVTKDGLLMYVGRLDNMVKIRGKRVQLEEVEAGVVRQYPQIQSCK